MLLIGWTGLLLDDINHKQLNSPYTPDIKPVFRSELHPEPHSPAMWPSSGIEEGDKGRSSILHEVLASS